MSRPLVAILLLLPLVALGGCGDDDDIALFSADDAKAFVHRWAGLIRDRRLEEAMEHTAAPFRFRTRTWPDLDETRTNLRTQLEAVRSELARTEAMECFSYRELSEGRWPQGRVGDLRTLGIQPDGYYVWLKRAEESNLPGMKLVLNPSPERERLMIQGIDPR